MHLGASAQIFHKILLTKLGLGVWALPEYISSMREEDRFKQSAEYTARTIQPLHKKSDHDIDVIHS